MGASVALPLDPPIYTFLNFLKKSTNIKENFVRGRNLPLNTIVFVCSLSETHRPEFFKECVGFGCEATRHNEKVEMCVADLTEKSLRKCAKKKYVHVTFKRSGQSNNRQCQF